MSNTYHFWIYAACYSIFFIQTRISKQNNSNRLFNDEGRLATKPESLTELYACGIMWLGLVPFALSAQSFESSLVPVIPNIMQSLLLISLLWIFIVTGKRASRSVQVSPENNNIFTKSFLPYFILLRIAFLCSYEIFFRGILLFDCVKWVGIPWAITISTAFTVLIHVFNSKKEMWACIPFGILLCSCCILFHAVWPAVILHIALCMSYELSFIHQFLTRLKPLK